MKYGAALICVFLLLSGCASENRELERGMELRSSLLSSEQCVFDAQITADYGDELYTFAVSCKGNAQGDLEFSVTGPETIAGITGIISDTGGKLTFDDAALQFDLMAEGLVSPVSAPWIFLKTLRGGYLTSAGMEEDFLRLTVDASYEDDALQLDIWLDDSNRPVRCEILHDGRRIVTMTVGNFEIR